MKRLSHDDYQALRTNATALEADQRGDKVLRLADGSFLKLFRRKRLISSAAWYPYAQRFADNARQLQQRGIPAPVIIETFRIRSIARDAVHYIPVPGDTLRHLVRQGLSPMETERLKIKFNAFVRDLHNKGVYFRSLHLGNVILTPGGELGLIDISDLRASRSPLRKALRARNLRRMMAIPGEREWIDQSLLLGSATHYPFDQA